jgi:acetyl-CoA C-acetyltransferase
MNDKVMIVAARRTPIGGFQGALSAVTATQLGAAAARAALADAGLAPDAVDEVLFGCVLPAGLGQAPARQAALGAGIAASVPATTVNKMCGSGMKALMLAADQILAGNASVSLAGGLESMSNAPYLLLKARAGYRMGHGEIMDHMFYDGLQSPWDGQAMGVSPRRLPRNMASRARTRMPLQRNRCVARSERSAMATSRPRSRLSP